MMFSFSPRSLKNCSLIANSIWSFSSSGQSMDSRLNLISQRSCPIQILANCLACCFVMAFNFEITPLDTNKRKHKVVSNTAHPDFFLQVNILPVSNSDYLAELNVTRFDDVFCHDYQNGRSSGSPPSSSK